MPLTGAREVLGWHGIFLSILDAAAVGLDVWPPFYFETVCYFIYANAGRTGGISTVSVGPWLYNG